MIFKESSTVELKEVWTSTLPKEVVAFANSFGGTIYIGVTDDGEVMGIEDAEEIADSIANQIRDTIEPDLSTSTNISLVKHNEKTIIRVEVQSASHKPYYLAKKGLKPSGVYVRHGTSSVPASVDTIRELIKEADGTEYDKMRSLEQELTFHYAENFFKKNNLSLGEVEQKTLKFKEVHGHYTNAALLFSDQCQHIIKCSIAGDEDYLRFQDRAEFTGSILKQLEDALSFLKNANKLSGRIEGLYRIDTRSFPEESIREALLNAVIHRDYDMSSPILVHVFREQMEIISVGGLAKGLTEEDILAGVSHCRNQVIANVFYRLKLIEAYGTGIRTILKNYKDFPIAPQFKAHPKSFVTILPNRNFKEKN